MTDNDLKSGEMPDERDTAYLNIKLWLQQALAHSAAGAYQNMHDKVATALHHLPIIKPIRADLSARAQMGDGICKCGVQVEERLSAGLETIICDSKTGYKHVCTADKAQMGDLGESKVPHCTFHNEDNHTRKTAWGSKECICVKCAIMCAENEELTRLRAEIEGHESLDDFRLQEIDVLKSQVDAAHSCIAEAAICLLKPNNGISDTIWLDKSITLYEHLVSELGADLTGDVDKDIETLAKWQAAMGAR